ncbi:MAG TPA: succinate dehydrogenase [Phycisphaerae bacterium]|nr:succinate dehydrogenase [Phycisphaerae bacterium]HOB73431.1 succinate dehydrogenase [Phycisphaerae bacterium]HOJ54917.1 succinate dehydrogenase [Phycisphaerae bacterium]HOL25073.1 succinate dehydrogenase [Phycisphaerae bacterium]HPP21374.1 succinate dehydrogenase [Phycisphaerae bacterium]
MSEAPGYPAARQEFLLRRLHSLAGLIPVGAFLTFHLFTNATILFDQNGDFYQRQVDKIHAFGPLLGPIEIAFIFIPLAFHAGLGVKMWLQGQPNTLQYPFWGNIRYWLQRVTGVIALVFILIHVWQMHWLGALLPNGGYFEVEKASGTTAWVLQHYRIWAGPVYLIGILCSVFHFANGIWTGLITWGITVGRNAQRRAGYVCAIIGLGLGIAGVGSLWGFLRFPHPVVPEKYHSPADVAVRAPDAEGMLFSK